MSQENVELVRRFLDEARESPEAVWDIFDEDVEWELEPDTLALPDVPAVSHGPDSVRDFFRRWVGGFEDWDYECEELIDCGDSVLARIHQWGRGRGSGVAVDDRFWQVWTLRRGRVIRTTHHREKAKALEAVGLRE